MSIQAASYDKYLSFDAVRDMGWWNLLWALLLVFLFLAAKAKMIGTTSIGKSEWGMLEILGLPLIPIPFGLWPFMKGVFHVKQVSTIPLRIPMLARREVNGRVLMVYIAVWVTVTKPAEGTLLQRFKALPRRFVEIRRDLIAALYGALDENVNDSENPARAVQTIDVIEAAIRTILKEKKDVDAVTLETLIDICGEDLRVNLGEYIYKVYIREDAPVDGTLWAEGRRPLTTEDDANDADDDLPPPPVIGIAPGSTG